MIVLAVSVLLAHIRSDAIKALAVASALRSDALSVPTTGEAGFKTVRSDNWYGLIAPAGLRAEVEAKLRKAAIKTLRLAELKKQFETQDALPSPSTPEEFTVFVKGGGGPKWNRCRRYQARLREAVGCCRAVEQGCVRQHRERTTCELRY